MRYRFKHVMEYAALRAASGLMRALPHRAALLLGWGAAAVSFALLRSRMRRTQARLRQVFGGRFSEREMLHIQRTAWRNFCLNVVESIRIPRFTLDWIKQTVDYEEVFKVLEFTKAGRGVIVAVPHMGNWELAGVALKLFGAPLMTIGRRQKNPLTDAFLNRMREYTGVEFIYANSKELAGVVAKLKQGKALAILPDLRAKTSSVKVNFLGVEAAVPTGMAVFAHDSNTPILAGCVMRVGWRRHRWKMLDLICPDLSLDRDTDLRRMTQRVLTLHEGQIREQPEQYFWFNRRWVLGED